MSKIESQDLKALALRRVERLQGWLTKPHHIPNPILAQAIMLVFRSGFDLCPEEMGHEVSSHFIEAAALSRGLCTFESCGEPSMGSSGRFFCAAHEAELEAEDAELEKQAALHEEM